jgi:hypothetical protein
VRSDPEDPGEEPHEDVAPEQLTLLGAIALAGKLGAADLRPVRRTPRPPSSSGSVTSYLQTPNFLPVSTASCSRFVSVPSSSSSRFAVTEQISGVRLRALVSAFWLQTGVSPRRTRATRYSD